MRRHQHFSPERSPLLTPWRTILATFVLGLAVVACGSTATQVAVPSALTPELEPPTVPPTSTTPPTPSAETPVAPAPTSTATAHDTALSDAETSDDADGDENEGSPDADLLSDRGSRRTATPTPPPAATAMPAETATTTQDGAATPTPAAATTPEADTDADIAEADGVRALVTATGIVVPVLAGGPGGWWIFSPCAQVTLITGVGATPVTGTTVMIDPGHGGDETGAVGPTGIIEGDVNLDVADRLLEWLAARNIDAMTTRTGDYRVAIHARGELAKAVQPDLFVSIHHNGGFPEPIDEPGTEVYFQYDNPESKRLGGLLYEEIYRTIESVDAQWYGNDHRGSQWRLNQEGVDLYGVLRRPAAAGVVAALTEATFIQTVEEEQLLTDPDFLQAEAEAIGRAIERWLTTSEAPDDASGGYNDGITFQGSLGPGGGTDGCIDPPLE